MTLRKIALTAALLAFLPALATDAQEPPEQEIDTRIQLRSMTFDPLVETPAIAAALRLPSPEATERWIVQFQRPLTREQRRMLTEEYGLALTEYVPNLAYLERLPPEALARLRQLDLVRATVAYQPAFKISPDIGGKRFRTEERRAMPGLLLRAVLFADADPEAAASALRAIEGVSEVEVYDFRDASAPARLEFQLASRAQLPEVARLEAVRWIEEVAEQDEDNGNTAGTMQSGTPGDEPVWDRGIHGEGTIIGVIDSGPVDIDHCMFEDPAGNVPSPTHRKVLEVRGAGTSGHATFVAGIALGDDLNLPGTAANRGNAWGARLVSGRRGEGLFNALIANRAQGATIHTNSWHDDTDGAGNPALYNQTASDADAFTWVNQDHLVLGSMGNNGEEQGPPGTSKNSIGINASFSDPSENTVGDGNPGPTADGRRKPDLVTPGCQINSAQVNTACSIQLRGCATSWATPAAAAAATLVRQYYAEGWYPTGTAQPAHAFTPTGSLVKSTLLNATLNMTGHAGYPGNTEGWGLLRLDNTLFFPGSARTLRAWDVRHADGLATGEFRTFSVDVASMVEPLKVTLAWADFPGAANAANPVVNDLDLTVIAPGGATFRGNVFAGGQSAPGGAADALNNVEQVLVNAPAIGTWTVRVAAPAVNVALPAQGQGFAVVASAAMSAPEIQVPGGVTFTDTCVGDTGVATLDVCNTGAGDLIVDSIASSNPRFAVTAPSSGFPVTVGTAFCFPFEVTFDPLAIGAQSATLTVASNDPETPSVGVTATSTGTEQDILVSGSTDFGVASAWSPAERAVEVCNVGHCDLAVASATIDCADFSLVADPLPATLSAGSCATVEVGFTPVLPGAKSCNLTINSDAPDSPAVMLPLTAHTPPAFSLHAGYADAHGALSAVAKNGSTLNLDFVYPVTPHWAWDVRLGVARLDGRPGLPDTEVWKLGANARFTVNPAAPVRVFLNSGPHLYHFDPGSFEGGLNLGLGLRVPVGSLFAVEATYNYHWALTPSPDLELSEIQLGMLVSF